MKIDRVLEQLKEAGYKVRVFHERATNADVEMAVALRDSGDKLALPQFMAKRRICRHPRSRHTAAGRSR